MDEVLSEVAQQLRDLLDAAGGSAVALTGAGMSTDSGIPDYRGPQGSYSRGHKPMTHDEFLSSESNRKRCVCEYGPSRRSGVCVDTISNLGLLERSCDRELTNSDRQTGDAQASMHLSRSAAASFPPYTTTVSNGY